MRLLSWLLLVAGPTLLEASSSPPCANGTCAEAADEDDDLQLLAISREGSGSSRRRCRRQGHNCNVGNCCEGLVCVGKQKNNGLYCEQEKPSIFDPLPVGEIPPAGLQGWITQALLTYFNDDLIPPILAASLAKLNAYTQTDAFEEWALDQLKPFQKAQVGKITMSAVTLGSVTLSFQQGAGIRVFFENIGFKVKATISQSSIAGLVAGGTVTIQSKTGSSLSVMIMIGTDEQGGLMISVPEDYIYNTIAIHSSLSAGGSTWYKPWQVIGNNIGRMIMVTVVAKINRHLKEVFASMGITRTGEVLFIPTLPPMAISGAVQGVNVWSDELLLSISGAPTIVTCNCTTPNAGTAGKNQYTCSDGVTSYCAADQMCTATTDFTKNNLSSVCLTTVSSSSMLDSSARQLLSSRAQSSSSRRRCRREGHNCNVGNCCSGLQCTTKANGGNKCTKPPVPLTTQPPPPEPTPPVDPSGDDVKPYPISMPVFPAQPNSTSMVGFRVTAYMINGQFWYMQELGLLNRSLPFPDNLAAKTWLTTQCGFKCKPENTFVVASSLLTPSLALANGIATLDLGVGALVKSFPPGKSEVTLGNFQLNMSVAVGLSIQPGANDTQQLLVEVNFDDVQMELDGLPDFLLIFLKKFLSKTINKKATLPGILDATSLNVQDDVIQVNTDISFAGMEPEPDAV